jgi:hypothetical protein
MDDLMLLFQAKNICGGFGSFILTVALISHSIRNFYFPYTLMDYDWNTSGSLKDATNFKWLLTNVLIYYDPRMSYKTESWKANVEQMDYLKIDIVELKNVSIRIF